MSKSLMPLLLPLLLLGATSGFGEDFITLGARAAGLGGAFTAVADDSTAFYWNPAGVAQGSFVRLGLFGGYSFQDRGRLVDHLYQGLRGENSKLDADRAIGFSGGFTVFGVAVTRFTQTSSVYDETTLYQQGLETWDVTASFVQSLPPDDLVIGFNVRFLRGTAYQSEAPAGDVPPSQANRADLMKRATSSMGKTENEPGLDFGVQYRPREWLHLGLSARNLNRPTFHTESGDDISLERHARAGVAFDLPRSFLLAVDIDLSRREGGPQSAEWRELAAGVEKSWKEGQFVLRGGLRTELPGASIELPGFSGGFAIRLGGFLAELAGMTGTQRRLGSLWLAVTFAR